LNKYGVKDQRQKGVCDPVGKIEERKRDEKTSSLGKDKPKWGTRGTKGTGLL